MNVPEKPTVHEHIDGHVVLVLFRLRCWNRGFFLDEHNLLYHHVFRAVYRSTMRGIRAEEALPALRPQLEAWAAEVGFD